MDSLISALSKLFTQAYEQGVADGRSQQTVDHKMIGRKDFDHEFGIKVDAFDKHYRDKQGFPSLRVTENGTPQQSINGY